MSGYEQEELHSSISNLKAELAGLTVRKETYENNLDSSRKRREELKKSLPQYEREIEILKKKSPAISKKQDELQLKRKEFEKIEGQKREFYSLKSQSSSLRDIILDKKKLLQKIKQNSSSILSEIETISFSISENSSIKNNKRTAELRKEIQSARNELSGVQGEEIEKRKSIAMLQGEIGHIEDIKRNIPKLDTCPLCMSALTDKHIQHAIEDSDKKISALNARKNNFERELEDIGNKKKIISDAIALIEAEINKRNLDSVKLEGVEEKKKSLKRTVEEEKNLTDEIKEMEEKRQRILREISEQEVIETTYDRKRLEIEEISARTEENIDIEISSKERELERITIIIKQGLREEKESLEEIQSFEQDIEEKSRELEEKDKAEKEMREKFQQLFVERNSHQEKIRQTESSFFEKQNEIRNREDRMNNFKIDVARIDAERESWSIEFKQFSGVVILNGSFNFLKDKLQKSEQSLEKIGTVNMRALDVYEKVKKEYDLVYEKVETLEKEKSSILEMINEIELKKKKTFMKTFNALNEIFSKNYIQLSTKGRAYLEIENKEDMFNSGINVIIRLAKGKYFDATSLSGGEQTLVALALIFAIQEYKPYSFYVFDEIDAALDKQNSERLGLLLKKHMQSGQYIIITHNDAIISESERLYGVSMHDGVSKVISLKL